MVLQHIIFPKPGICTDEELYFRRKKTDFTHPDVTPDTPTEASHDATRCTFAEECITLEKDAIISLDTYFNSIPARRWKQYTGIVDISIQLTLQGAFCVTLVQSIASNAQNDVQQRTLAEHLFSCEETTTVSYPFHCLTQDGLLYVRLRSMRDGSVFLGGGYTAELASDQQRDVRIAICICTFKREAFLKKNLQVISEAFLSSENDPFFDKLEVYISDNGQTLGPSFLQSIPVRHPEKMHIFRNKNVGGSGGFTRCMIEALEDSKEKGFTHVLLMDDDVMFDPESIFRTFTLLSCLREDYQGHFLGGAMLLLEDQPILYESGAIFRESGYGPSKTNLSLDRAEHCLIADLEEYAEYAGWWYCAIPMEYVRKNNLPLPFFIHCDDIEYCMRNAKGILLINGICVWHEGFPRKYSTTNGYFDMRNELICGALHFHFGRGTRIAFLYRHVMHEVIRLRYRSARLMLRGAEDFLKGGDWLAKQDAEALHKIIQAAAYQLIELRELSVPFTWDWYDAQRKLQPKHPRLWHATRRLRLLGLNGLLLPARKTAIVSTTHARLIHFRNVRNVLHYDPASQKGFVTKKSIKEALSIVFSFYGVAIRIMLRYGRLEKDYREKLPKLMQLDFWESALDRAHHQEQVVSCGNVGEYK